jgi:hypothetical protein
MEWRFVTAQSLVKPPKDAKKGKKKREKECFGVRAFCQLRGRSMERQRVARWGTRRDKNAGDWKVT